MNKPFKGINIGTGQFHINTFGKIPIQGRPVEIHLKEDGAKDDQPSFALVTVCESHTVVGQISLKMLNDGLADIGYQLVKTDEKAKE